MAYSKQTFADGQKLTADHMNHIESGLAALDTGKLDASALDAAITSALAQAADNGSFDGEDGVGISGIARTSGSGAAGSTDTYTIRLTDGSSYTFSVYNGKDGIDGADGSGGSGGEGVSVTGAEINGDGHLIITLSDNSTIDAGMAKGDTGATGAAGARGTKWYTGTAISGGSTTGAVYSDSGVTYAFNNDLYLNTSNGRLYKCIYAGPPESATWGYLGSLRGAAGASGKDGANAIESAAINSSGSLVITLDNGDTLTAGKVVGDDGYSPAVTVSSTAGGHYVEIKSMKSGLEKVDGFFVYDGAAGADGLTPVRGTDYWTNADIAEIKGYVDDAILGGTW